jgi:hypothetical protein
MKEKRETKENEEEGGLFVILSCYLISHSVYLLLTPPSFSPQNCFFLRIKNGTLRLLSNTQQIAFHPESVQTENVFRKKFSSGSVVHVC